MAKRKLNSTKVNHLKYVENLSQRCADLAKEEAALVDNEGTFIGCIRSDFAFVLNLLDHKETEIIADVQKHTMSRLKGFSDERLACAAELSNAKLVQNEAVLALQQDGVNFLSLVKGLMGQFSVSQVLLDKRVTSPIPSGALTFPKGSNIPALSMKSERSFMDLLATSHGPSQVRSATQANLLASSLVKSISGVSSSQGRSGSDFIVSSLREAISRVSVTSNLGGQEVSRKRPRFD
jgi:hypothetical protein